MPRLFFSSRTALCSLSYCSFVVLVFFQRCPSEVLLKVQMILAVTRVSLTFCKWDKFVTWHKQTEKPNVSFMLKYHCLPRRDQLYTEMFNGAIKFDTRHPCISAAGLKSCLLLPACVLASAENNPNSVNKEKNQEMTGINGIHALLQT